MTRQSPASTHAVVILGGGIAGCAAALALCHRGIDDVLIVEAGAYDAFQIGESIPPETRLLLERLQAWEGFVDEGHEPCLGSRSAWGDDAVGHNDFLLNPHGTGWHLDRRQFGVFMARKATQAGAKLRSGTRFVSAERVTGETWALRLEIKDEAFHVHARFVVDATGVQSRLARSMAATPLMHDRLVCIGAVLGCPASDFSRLTMLEAVETGWWYAARLPGERVLAAAITDGETNKRAMLHQPEGWLSGLRKTRHMAAWLEDCSFPDDRRLTMRAAPSFVLDRVCGSNWLAVGDAASAYDPIASQGIYKALSDGLEAAAAIAARGAGVASALDRYQASIVDRFTAYLTVRNHFYDLEQRWPASPFWRNRRRQRSTPPVPASREVHKTVANPR